MDVLSRPLSWKAARTLYNLSELWWPPPGEGRSAGDPALAPERVLLHRGPRAARTAWLWLTWLDWEPMLRGGRRFWQLPAEERRLVLERWQASPLRRRGLGWLRAWLEEARPAAGQSSPGA